MDIKLEGALETLQFINIHLHCPALSRSPVWKGELKRARRGVQGIPVLVSLVEDRIGECGHLTQTGIRWHIYSQALRSTPLNLGATLTNPQFTTAFRSRNNTI